LLSGSYRCAQHFRPRFRKQSTGTFGTEIKGTPTDAAFVWFPRRDNPVLYDRMMQECVRGGFKSPRIVQEAVDEATILSLVATGLGVGWVLGTARWRRPNGIVILSVVDMKVPMPLALVWRKDNESPLLARFVVNVRRLLEARDGLTAR
jgi:DNA-binding transcriptional LysR family regulator